MRFRRPLLIILVIAVPLLIIVGISLLGKEEDKLRTTCDNFIQFVIKKDSASSYAMFSDTAKSVDSQESWDIKVTNLFGVYNLGEVTFVSQSDVTQTQQAENGDLETVGPQRIEFVYTLTNPIGTSDITCNIIQSGSDYKVDGFTSGLREDVQ